MGKNSENEMDSIKKMRWMPLLLKYEKRMDA